MRTCLITGGAGFIGSHLAEIMVKKGWGVTIIDNLSSGKLENLQKIQKNIKFINIDVRDFLKLRKMRLKADAIIHLAALVSVNKSISNPREAFSINLSGTINILELARSLDINKIIFASTAAVYGNINKEKITEKDDLKPISPYGLSKLMAEKVLALYSKLYGLTTVSLRLFNVYGPRQNSNSPYSGVISRFLARIKSGKRPIIYGTGKQTRDFLYVDDAVTAILKTINLEGRKNYVYNVGTGQPISINNLLELLLELIPRGKEEKVAKAIYRPARKEDILLSGADINKIKKELNFVPQYDLCGGLKKLIQATFF